ncbi:MAG TPA: single-stranded DNA-binding protein [Ruminococcaceae bacterium]|nr:single-stranded DNA-binding protein [Oscillospiraceae bacterium]
MLNCVALMGRLAADPELKETQSGTSVVSFRVACDRSYCKAGQERQTDWINCVAWRSTAEFICKYFRRGQLIALQGSLQTRSYTDKDGNKRKAFEVVADHVHFAESKKDSSNNNTYPARGSADVEADDFEEMPDDDDLPF